MVILRFCLALCLFFTPFVPVQAGLKVQEEETIADGLVLIGAEFGLFEESPDGSVVIKAADTIPFKEGQAYGWRLRFRTQRESVNLKEELQLPSRPKTWNTPLRPRSYLRSRPMAVLGPPSWKPCLTAES